jgi:hypothetical protein
MRHWTMQLQPVRAVNSKPPPRSILDHVQPMTVNIILENDIEKSSRASRFRKLENITAKPASRVFGARRILLCCITVL